ncbi:MAG: hypothetical protein ACLR0U_12590 [Enterocloster clostridioformis]
MERIRREFKTDCILETLLEHEEYLPVSFYAGKMDVSDKTLRRMIPGVNEDSDVL